MLQKPLPLLIEVLDSGVVCLQLGSLTPFQQSNPDVYMYFPTNAYRLFTIEMRDRGHFMISDKKMHIYIHLMDAVKCMMLLS